MFKPYEQYKPSGIKWLGDVPEHWNVKAIKWESPVLRGASPRPIDNEIYFADEGEYAWVRISDVTSAGMYLRETTQRLSHLGRSLSVPLQPGALFLSIAGSVGKPCITAVKCCIHNGFVYFPFWRGESRFLYYMFASGEPYKGLGKLGTQLNLNTDTVGSIVAGFPNAFEQRAIADFLDRETAKIDKLVVKKQTLIERLKEKRTALISRTVTRGLPPDAALASGLNPHPKLKPSGINWLGEVPEHWRTTRLKYVAEKIVDCPHETPVYAPDGDYVVIRTADLTSGRVDLSATYKLEEEEYKKRIRREPLLAGDIVYGREGERWGFAATVPIGVSCCLGQRMMQFRTRRNYHPRFMMWHLNATSVYQQGDVDTLGATSPHVNVETIRNYLMVHPPFEEQLAIADFLDCHTAKIDQMIAKVEAAIERLQEYRTALITAAVTGKIDVHLDAHLIHD